MRIVGIFLRVLGDILSGGLENVVGYRVCEQGVPCAITNQSISYKEEHKSVVLLDSDIPSKPYQGVSCRKE